MTISANTVWEIRSTATANMVNGGGFVTGSGGTDYSQQNTAQWTGTNGTGTGTTNFSSAGATFTAAAVGNILHITAGTGATVGWYQITAYVDASNVTLDRAFGTTSNATFYIGGALNTYTDAFGTQLVGGNTVWVKQGSYTLAASSYGIPSVSGGSFLAITGYQSTRGDTPSVANRPTFSIAGNTWQFNSNCFVSYINFDGTTGVLTYNNSGGRLSSCRVSTVTAGAGTCVSIYSDGLIENCEIFGKNTSAVGITLSPSSRAINCFVHDCGTGIRVSNNASVLNCIVSNCRTQAIETYGNNVSVEGCTLQGFSVPRGYGIYMGSSRYNNRFYNNTISGFATGVYRQTANDPQTRGNFNNFYNNTTNVTNYTQGPNDLALNPSFTDISAVTGTTATSFNYTLTDNAADFSSVVDGESTLHVFSGTGATVLFSTVVSHTLHTVTIAPGTGTSVAGDIVYQVSIGRNFSIGTNLKAAAAFVLPGTAATSYLDIGAVQRQEAGAATVTTARAYVG